MVANAMSLLLLTVPGGALGAGAKFARAKVLQGACAVAALPGAIEVYSRAPPRWSLQDLPKVDLPPNIDRLCIVVPGSGGADANTARIVDALRASSQRTAVVEYDWLRFGGDDQLRAPYNAKRIGEHLGRSLASQAAAVANQSPPSVHVVAVSAGGFLGNALVGAFTKAFPTASRPHVRLTLCDAFTARGLVGLIRPQSAFGVNNFGATADYCEAFINVDDPVPSTSLPLRCAANYDVTGAAARASFTPLPGDSLHSWPAAWYGANCRALLSGELGLTPRHGVAGAPSRGALSNVA